MYLNVEPLLSILPIPRIWTKRLDQADTLDLLIPVSATHFHSIRTIIIDWAG